MRLLLAVVAIPLMLAGCSAQTISGIPNVSAHVGPLRDESPNVTTQHLYVLNTDIHSITVYPVTANGNVAPLRSITGSNTMLGTCFPNQITVDKSGKLYVSCQRVGSSWGILVFAAGANGNVAPTTTIGGNATLLDFPYGLGTDRLGNLDVSNCGTQCTGSGSPPSVTVYAPGASGNVAPIRIITGSLTQMGCSFPCPLAVDHAGKIYQFNTQSTMLDYTVYSSTANGDVAPIRTLHDKRQSGPNLSTSSMAFDSVNDMFTVTYLNGSVEVDKFNMGARGKINPASILSGSSTQLVQSQSIALDATNQEFVGNCGPCGGGSTESVTVYAAGASGNVAPIAMIAGSATGLGAIQSIAIGK